MHKLFKTNSLPRIGVGTRGRGGGGGGGGAGGGGGGGGGPAWYCYNIDFLSFTRSDFE